MYGCGSPTCASTIDQMESLIQHVPDIWQQNLPIVDVRAPVEFSKGHIPGALNVPLLTNDDRHQVGLCYRQQGQKAAVQLGLQLVGPRLADLAQEGMNIARSGSLIVYCQRGGQRSQSMSWLWTQIGLRVWRIEGGYRKFRQWVNQELQRSHSLLLLAGGTGVGKTDILHALTNEGEAVLDLEGYARHKGSAFGAIGEDKTAKQGHFENCLATQLHRIQGEKPVWVESESQRIGNCQIPPQLWSDMQQSPRIYLERDRQQRVVRLCEDYKDASVEELQRALNGIRKRLGPEKYQRAVNDLMEDNRAGVVDSVLDYYDRLYDKYKRIHHARIMDTVDISQQSMASVIQHLKSLKDEKYPQIE